MNQEDIQIIESRIKSFEEKTGCELLLILAKNSDDYPGASWRFGVMGGLILTFIFSLFFEFHHAYWWPFFMFSLTLFMAWIGHFPFAKRFTLQDGEVETETKQRAIECFHQFGTSKVSHKVTAMIFVSVMERQIIVLVDETLKTRITQEELDELVTIMKVNFKCGQMTQGFFQSIESLESKILKDFGGKVSEVNPRELSDQIHFL
jgi:uncharacterized membrane protein